MKRRIPSHLAGLICVAASALLLTGCQATLTTSVDADGDKVTGSFSVVLENEAAEALQSDPATDQLLMQTIADRTGATVTRDADDERIIYRSGIPAEKSLTDISGVSIQAVERTGEDVKISFRLTEPKELLEALRNATAKEADAAARLLVIQRTTKVCAEASYAGAISSANGDQALDLVQDGNIARGCATLEVLSQGDLQFTVVGNPNRKLLPFLVGGAGILSALVLAYRRWLKR